MKVRKSVKLTFHHVATTENKKGMVTIQFYKIKIQVDHPRSTVLSKIARHFCSVADPGSGAFLISGSGIQTLNFESLVTIFWVKITLIL